MADHRLHAEAVEDSPEDLVVVEAGDEALVERGLLGLDAVDDPLVEVGGAQAPDPAGEVDVVRVVDLGEVVERAGDLRERQHVLAALVLDLDVALLDVDVGSAVLPHRPELHQVGVGTWSRIANSRLRLPITFVYWVSTAVSRLCIEYGAEGCSP